MRAGRSLRVLGALAVLWGAYVFAQTPTCPTGPPCQGGVVPGPLPLFPASNWWNLDISAAPVDSNSANFISFINNGGNRQLHPDFGGEVDPGSAEIYGIPYVIVNGTQPKKVVTFLYDDESDGVGVPFYPIPDQAITQPHWIEEGNPGNIDLRNDSDRHLLMIDTDNKLLYELYNVWYDTSISSWQAGSGALFDLKTNNRRPEGWTSADAAGLAIVPGLVRYDEAYLNPDPIRHAIRVTVRATNGYVFPASHLTCDVNDGDSCPANALPMGARLRMKPGTTVASADLGVQRIVQAMKTYGLIVADNGSDMYFSGTFDTRWDNGILNPVFHGLHANDFEVIQRGWGSNFTDLAITKTDNLTAAIPGQQVTYTIVVSNPGPAIAVGATVVDTLPAAITGATWTCVGSAAGDCVVGNGSGSINRTVNLPVGGGVTFTVTGTISPSASGTLVNTATISPPGGTIDPNPTNNSATDSDILPGVDYFTVTPCRVVDTRGGAPIGGPVLQGQQTRVLAIAGKCSIPASARAVSVNLAVTGATAAGNLRLFPAGQAVPLISSINYAAGQTRANNAVVKLNASGSMSAFVGQTAGTTVHLILDVNGYFQ